jgi:tRNA (guanine-N7-)-methyltransferase
MRKAGWGTGSMMRVTETGSDQRTERSRSHLYGRRIGRAIGSAHADLLATRFPALRLDPSRPPPRTATELFDAPVRDVWMEIGFGAGEHLLWQAEANRDVGFIGCEPFLNGVAKAVSGIEEEALANVRLYDNDARHLLQWLPKGSLGRLFILFPDPWPKKRHRKRRFLTEDGLGLIARALRPGAELRFATDIADYAAMVLDGIEKSAEFRFAPGLLPERPADWPLTRYAEKAVEAGRECRFFVFART